MKTCTNFGSLPEKIFKEYCYEMFEQFSDLWLTSSAVVYNDTNALGLSLGSTPRAAFHYCGFGGLQAVWDVWPIVRLCARAVQTKHLERDKKPMSKVDGLPMLAQRPELRGPAAILFISRNTCSDSIAKEFGACFCGGIAQLSRNMLQKGVSHRCVCVKLSTKAGYRIILGSC